MTPHRANLEKVDKALRSAMLLSGFDPDGEPGKWALRLAVEVGSLHTVQLNRAASLAYHFEKEAREGLTFSAGQRCLQFVTSENELRVKWKNLHDWVEAHMGEKAFADFYARLGLSHTT